MDIIIGTHKLLGSELTFKDLGLLIVDDSPAIHGDFAKILCPAIAVDKGLGATENLLFCTPSTAQTPSFELDSAFQGREALDKLEAALAQNRPYAMAFIDMRMPPGWDGLETIERLWQVDPKLQVALCTAYSDYSWEDIDRRLALKANAAPPTLAYTRRRSRNTIA